MPALEKLAKSGDDALGRVHALWALEGLNAATPSLLSDKLSDADPRVRQAAIRVSEPFLTEGNEEILKIFEKLENEKDADVATQAINSIAYSDTKSDAMIDLVEKLIESHQDKPIFKNIADNQKSLAAEAARLAEQRRHDAKFGKQMEQGAVIYKQLCFACHGADGKGAPMAGQKGMTLGPPLPGSPRVLGSGGSLVRTLLHGQTGPLDGKTYPGQMLPLGSNDDEWIAAVATYIRNSFGNKAAPVTEEFVAGIRKQSEDRLLPWTEEELEKLEPPLLTNRKDWKLRASHNSGSLSQAIDGQAKTRYDTGAPQVPGQWVQIELPKVSTVNRIVLDSTGSSRDYIRNYEVQISDNGKTWSKPVSVGKGQHPLTDIIFPSVETKYIRITQQGSAPRLYWSIHEMQIYGKPVN